MIYVLISDIHGAFNTLQALLVKVAAQLGDQPYEVILLGDLIDRGPRSREVVEWAMTNKIRTTKGNHEDLALAYSEHAKMGFKAKCARHYDRNVWLLNGGDDTLKSWGPKTKTLPRDVLEWMSDLPPYILIEEPTSENRKLLCSHTGYGLDADKDNWLRALWGRYPDDGDWTHEKGTGKAIDDGLFRCFGHTKTRKVEVMPAHVNIDSGAAYRGYEVMTAFVWPSKQLIQVSYQD